MNNPVDSSERKANVKTRAAIYRNANPNALVYFFSIMRRMIGISVIAIFKPHRKGVVALSMTTAETIRIM